MREGVELREHHLRPRRRRRIARRGRLGRLPPRPGRGRVCRTLCRTCLCRRASRLRHSEEQIDLVEAAAREERLRACGERRRERLRRLLRERLDRAAARVLRQEAERAERLRRVHGIARRRGARRELLRAHAPREREREQALLLRRAVAQHDGPRDALLDIDERRIPGNRHEREILARRRLDDGLRDLLDIVLPEEQDRPREIQPHRLAQHAAQIERRPVRRRAAHDEQLPAVHPIGEIIILRRIDPADGILEPPRPREIPQLAERRQRFQILAAKHLPLLPFLRNH